MTIALSPTLRLPDDAITQTFAFMARKGAGKSYGAMLLAEGMLDIGGQIVALDPVGVWYGLRIAGNGKGPGYDIPIFGGLHGDIPLEPGAGALVADLIVDRGISVVLDVSHFRKSGRKLFVTDFAEQLFHRKKQQRSPLHLFLEEAQFFVPQRVVGADARMLGAFEDIVKVGRSNGIGVTMISQRPQSVNKEVLNQTEALFVLQTSGSQERKALREWIVEHGVQNTSLVDELPGLPIGTAYLWSPSWLRKLEKVKLGKRKTYDSSATPTMRQKRIEPRPLSREELGQVEAAMAATIAKAKADDPKALRARISELEAQIRTVPASRPDPPATVIEKTIEVAVLAPGEAEALAQAAKDLAGWGEPLRRILGDTIEPIVGRAEQVGTAIVAALARAERPANPMPARPAPNRHTGAIVGLSDVREAPPAASNDAAGSLGKADRAILTALAQNPDGCEKAQLAVLSGYSVTSSSFGNTLSRLRVAEYINRGDPIRALPAGLAALGSFEPLPTGEALHAYWYSRLGKAEATILRVLVAAYPASLSKVEIATASVYSVTSSSFGNALSKLRTLKLAEGYGPMRASASLF